MSGARGSAPGERRATRGGTVLIAIAGICAVMATLAAAFLIRMRADADENAFAVHETQARVMLVAGCNYVLEGARLGWDRRVGLAGRHDESHGWIDVRTGTPGPLDADRLPLAGGAASYPAIGGKAARCPMQVRQRPPFAVQLRVCYNPIPGLDAGNDVGKPLLTNPDPQPTLLPGETNTDAVWRSTWRFGDPRPRSESTGLAWFRCYRESAAVFVITCGAGGTLGYRDWQDVTDDGAQDAFGDGAAFATMLAAERRLWYRIEWSAAIAAPDFHLTDNEFGRQFTGDETTYGVTWGGSLPNGKINPPADNIDNYYMHARNSTLSSHGRSSRCQIHDANPVGTIRWVQRLDGPPPEAPGQQRW